MLFGREAQPCMKIVGRERLELFCRKHADARTWIERWLADVERAAWRTPQDVRNQYASASFLADGVVIFNVKGNAYRLEVAAAYRTGTVAIRWAGTHRGYDERNRKR
jgi:mRNA interferase HigB